MERNKRIILFGGTFDPVHAGHICVAEFALQVLDADILFFIPAFRSPHKQRVPTDAPHRLAMLDIATRDKRGLFVDDCEIRRRQTSYTLETIYDFRRRYGPEADLFWLIGADQLKDLEKWYKIHILMAQCRLVVMVRGGYPLPDVSRFEGLFPDEQVQQLRSDMIQTPQVPVSSTEIRAQFASGQVPQGALPPGVPDYIREHHLYGSNVG